MSTTKAFQEKILAEIDQGNRRFVIDSPNWSTLAAREKLAAYSADLICQSVLELEHNGIQR